MSQEKQYSISEEAYRNKLSYIADYNKKMARLTIQMSHEDKARIKEIADSKGMTIKELVISAIEDYVSH